MLFRSNIPADYILLSHGHQDHILDAEAIAKRTGAALVSNHEITEYYRKRGIDKVHGMNHGGYWNFEFGKVKYVVAIHSSSFPDGTYAGNPGGFLIETREGNFYYSGDTALTAAGLFDDAVASADQAATDAGTTPCRWLDNGDGTATDLGSGLQWELKNSDMSSVHYSGADYKWTDNDGGTPDGAAFTDFLGTLNGGTSPDGTTATGCFAGHCDWRLPSVEELLTIVDASQAVPPRISPVFGPTQSYIHFTATTFAGGYMPYYAWYVDFSDGNYANNGFKLDAHYVRAVRSAP